MPIPSISEYTPILLPILIALFTSLYDGTIIKAKKTINKIKVSGQGKLEAKICLSGISFDVWGLSVLLQSKTVVPLTDVGIFLIIFFICHVGFHYLCLKLLNINKYRGWRYFLVSFSIIGPLILIYPHNYFIF